LVDCLESKRAYAAKHGYTYVQGGEEFWDRERPIAWSKIPFLLNFLKTKAANFDYIWFSDADVYITNPSTPLTEIAALMPASTNLLLNVDAWHNVNSGNMLMRLGVGGTTWLADYFSRVWERKADLYHIWYENKAMIDEYEAKPSDKARIYFNKDHKRFNAYLNGRPGEPLWTPGDFLVHFAGIYNTAIMKGCVENIKAGGTPRIDAP
jgi:hypothetical protein